MKKKQRGITIWVSAIFSILLFAVSFIWFGPEASPSHHIDWGLNFSQSQAEYLGLDWKEVYQATLKDLQAKNYRLSAYWNRIEKQKDKFDFSELDYMLTEAQKNNANVLMAVGLKLPRWPECHYPDWAKSLPKEELQKRILRLLSKTVEHVRKYDNVIAWQVENEPFLDFGECPPLDKSFLKQEIGLVKFMDRRPVLITESGELSTWTNALGIADLIGISLYRTVWSDLVGMFAYPLTPSFYNRHAQLISPWVTSVWITELQAEPWGSKSIREMTFEEQKQRFDASRFAKNLQFVRRTRFDHAVMWGSEYWYYLKKFSGDDSLWNKAKEALSAKL